MVTRKNRCIRGWVRADDSLEIVRAAGQIWWATFLTVAPGVHFFEEEYNGRIIFTGGWEGGVPSVIFQIKHDPTKKKKTDRSVGRVYM